MFHSEKKPHVEEKPKNNRDKLCELVQYYLVDLFKHETPTDGPGFTPELELRFTGGVTAEKNSETPPISKEDYYSVLQVFKTLDPSFSSTSSNEHLLRIYPCASNGHPPKSKIRCEITGILNIQKYCKTNDWRQCDNVKFVMKKPAQKLTKKIRRDNPRIETEQLEPIPDVYMKSYAIKASYKHEISFDKTQIETYAETDPEMKFILRNWTSAVKKTFRHMTRFSFTIGNQGLVKMDASIVKSSSQDSRGQFLPAIDIHQSNVFENFSKYEIELEVNNENCQGLAPTSGIPPPHAPSRGITPPPPPPGDDNQTHIGGHAVATSRGLVGQSPDLITDELMTTIRKVLIGLQKSRFPIPKDEMETVLEDYYRVVYHLKEKDSIRQVIRHHPITAPKYFVGPSSVALKFEHLYPNDITETQVPYVMENYTLTEKADGERCLLFVSPRSGKAYLIDMNMNIRFTGLSVSKENIAELGGLILDGEHVTKDINDFAVSMFLAFDLYFREGHDYRPLPFLNCLCNCPERRGETNICCECPKKRTTDSAAADATTSKKDSFRKKVGRYSLLKGFVEEINRHTEMLPYATLVGFKDFYVLENPQDFGLACDTVLSKYYPYKIDGLVFTPSYAAVGAEHLFSKDPSLKTKKRWQLSIKWKPSEYNTNDFLVTTVKTETNEDVIGLHMEPSLLTGAGSPLTEYKTLQLRCGFNRFTSGYPGAFLKILSLQHLEEEVKEESSSSSSSSQHRNENYLPTLFYPTDYPDRYSHLSRVRLKMDCCGNQQMWTEDGEVINDQTIVEFKYVTSNPEGFRWVPLRLRQDKTYEYRTGGKCYGNDYETANGNWKSIMNPITREMLTEPLTLLPAYQQVKMINDAYYDRTDAGDRHVLQNFHGYVKFKLISSATLPGQTIIDLACGKAGDLWRWKNVQASFVFGVDYSRDNIENRFDGAAARYMNFYRDRERHLGHAKTRVTKPHEEGIEGGDPNFLRCVFVQGDVSKNVRSGEAMMNDLSKEITDSVFGEESRSFPEIRSRGSNGFDVCSCQFALHYFFRDLPTLQGFMINVCQNLKKGGYFIGTCYDGKRVFDKLKHLPLDGWASIRSSENGGGGGGGGRAERRAERRGEETHGPALAEEYWICTKKYTQTVFDDDSSSLGYQINVFQKSIGAFHEEYLVNFDYLVRVMENYGFEKVDITPFDEFYHSLDPLVAEEHGFVGLTDLNEWGVSTLNNTFKFKKVKDGFDPLTVVLDTEPIREKEKELEKQKELEKEKEKKTQQDEAQAEAVAAAAATRTSDTVTETGMNLDLGLTSAAATDKKRKSRKVNTKDPEEDDMDSGKFNKTKKKYSPI